MFDIWMGDIELTTFVLIFSIIVLLPVQLLLCFKVKNKVICLLPVVNLLFLQYFSLVWQLQHQDGIVLVIHSLLYLQASCC